MSPGSWKGRRWLRDSGLAVVLFVVVTALSSLPFLRELDRRVADTLFRSAPHPGKPSRLLIVSIDDASLYKYGRWPWSRVLLADLLRKIASSKPAVIGLDILLAEPQSARADDILSEALSSAPSVIVDKIGEFPEGPRWVEPLPQFSKAAAGVGHAQAVLDSDGICRSFPPRQLTLEGARYAFGIEVATRSDRKSTTAFLERYGIPAVENHDARITTASPSLIPIAFRSDGFETVSAATLLQGNYHDVIRGRTVLVGFGPTELGDRIPTPVSRNAPTPGVEVHAHIVDAILEGRYLRELSATGVAALTSLLCFAVVVSYRSFRGWKSLGILFVEGALVFGTGAWLFWWRQYVLPDVSFAMVFLIGPVLSSTFDILAVERSVNRQLHQLQGWLVAHRPEQSRASLELEGRLQFLQELQVELGSLYELHRSLLSATQDLVAVYDDAGALMLSNGAFRRAWGRDANWPVTLAEARSRLVESTDAPLKANEGLIEGEASAGELLYFVRIVPLPPTAVSPHGGTILNMTNLRARVERDRSRAESVGFITHELRTPLVSIQGFAELMLRYPDSPACSQAPATILRESKRLLALVNSYLDVLRLDAGARPLRLERIALKEIVLEVFAVLEPIAADSGMSLRFAESEAVTASGDRLLLTGVVLNLVSNALKYGKPNTEIQVSAEAEGMEAILHVKNDGPAIPDHELASIFRTYVRGENSTRRQEAGWGLGLSFVKRIVEKHGGSVSVRSNDAGGTVFSVRLSSSIVAAAAKEA